MLRGLMMDYPLVLTHFLERARRFFPRAEVVSRLPDGSIHRYGYAEWYRRVCRLAHALTALGVRPGDRVATLCWNHYRHLELYFAVPAIGAVLHTLNLRLHPSELGYIASHAGDRVIFADRSLLGLLDGFRGEVTSLEHVVVVPDDGVAPAGMLDYEALLEPHPEHFDFPRLDENAAAVMCYTSGTTGNPKGVLYSHRSTVLHTLALCLTDTKAVSERDCILPIVPMFHANAWGLPFAAVAMGSKIVFPGPDLKPESLLDLMAAERVTLAAAVPTIWLGVLALLDEHAGRWDLSSMRLISIGGSAAPPALIDGLRRRHGLGVVHAWGMTETNPLATVSRIKEAMSGLDDDLELAVRAKQGYAIPFVEQRHVDEEGLVLPWDGLTMGELEVRGPWVAAAYYDNQEAADRFTADGWFKTGDVVTVDAEGYVQITDRSKDVIKSGGEWISTQALENALMSHPAVLEAAVFAARHLKWDERPLAAVVLKPGKLAEKTELEAHLRDQFPKWWLPEDYLFLDQIPRTSTGKFKKRELRERFGDHLLANDRA
jgi:fatty-acyl-CoA synthase